MYSWRGDERDLALRQRVAALRDAAGQWRPAMTALREAAELWPERATQMRPQLAATFAHAMAAEGKEALKPFDLVTLAEENADLVPDGEAGRVMAGRIADQLAALELPGRAATVLQKLVEGTAQGPARAEFGTRLARLRQDAGDHPGALEALTLTATPDLPPPDQERRTLIFARSAAALGDLGSALSALADLTSAAGLALRADLLEAAQDWRGTVGALSDLLAQGNPPEGMLDAANARLVLRLASAAVRAGDVRVLGTLRAAYLARLPKEATAMLDMLSAEPVGGVADLPRATQEMRLAKGLTNGLRTLTQ